MAKESAPLLIASRDTSGRGHVGLYGRQAFLGNSPDVRTERVNSKEVYRRGCRFLIATTVFLSSGEGGKSTHQDSSAPSTSRHLHFSASSLAKLCHQELNGGHLPPLGQRNSPPTILMPPSGGA